MKNFVELGWNDYAKQCVPAKQGSTQYEESKKAFFAGGIVVMTAMQVAGRKGVPENAAVALMITIESELEEFKTKMDAAAAEQFHRNRNRN